MGSPRVNAPVFSPGILICRAARQRQSRNQAGESPVPSQGIQCGAAFAASSAQVPALDHEIHKHAPGSKRGV